jgi:hypothetical protein
MPTRASPRRRGTTCSPGHGRGTRRSCSPRRLCLGVAVNAK